MKTRQHKAPGIPLRFLKMRVVARMLGYDSTISVRRFLQRTGLPFLIVNERMFSVEEGPFLEWMQGRRVVYVPAKKGRRPRLVKQPTPILTAKSA